MVKQATEIVGIEQLEDVLNKLPGKVNRSVLLSTTRESGKGLLARAKQGLESANRMQGSPNVDMAENVKMWSLRKSKTFRAGVAVGFKPQYDGREQNKVFRQYAPDISRQKWAIRGALWLEYGTSGRTRKGGAARQIKPHGWFRRAVDTSIRGIEKNFKQVLHKKINQFLNRYIKKHGW